MTAPLLGPPDGAGCVLDVAGDLWCPEGAGWRCVSDTTRPACSWLTLLMVYGPLDVFVWRGRVSAP